MDEIKSVTSATGSLEADVDATASALIKELAKRVASSTKKWRRPLREIRAARSYVRGESVQGMDSDGAPVLGRAAHRHQANVTFATLQTMLPTIYAKNPEIAIRPSEHVDPASDSYKEIGRFADTLETVVNKTLLQGNIKRVAKKCIRAVQTSRVAVVKVSYQRDFYRDLKIAARVSDLQQQLASMRGRAQHIAEEPGTDTEDLETELLTEQMKAFEKRVDVLRAEGAVVDFVPIEHFRLDPGVDSLDQYMDARWMAMCTPMGAHEIRTDFGVGKEVVEKLTARQRTVSGATYHVGENTGANPEKIDHDATVYFVWEFWDKESNTVYTWGEGGDDWLREPLQPDGLGERWFPFFLLGFNWMDGSEWPVSDVELLRDLADEYDDIRKQSYAHRKLSAPKWLGDSSRMGRTDVETYTDASIGDVVLINAGGEDVNRSFVPAAVPPMNPQVYDTAPIWLDIERVLGITDAYRGQIQRAKTATEAGIQQSGLTTRIDEKRDTMEDWLSDIAIYTSQLVMLEMSVERVFRIAGPGAFWPKASREELFSLVEIELRAGSLGKPDKQQDHDNWTQLLPLLMELRQYASQERAQGVPDEDNGSLNMLIETLKRFDERIDIEKFIAGPPQHGQEGSGAIGPQGASPEEMAAEQQMAQMAAQGEAQTAGAQQQHEQGMQDSEQRHAQEMRRREAAMQPPGNA